MILLTAATLYSVDHSALDGQVNKNLQASNGMADYTNFDAVYQLFSALVDEAGDNIDIQPTQVLIPLALRATAAKIIKSDFLMSTGDTDVTNLPTYNPISDLGADDLDIIPSIYMPDTTTWYMGDFPKQLRWVNIFPAAVAVQGAESESSFTNQIVARFRFNFHAGLCHTDWRYIVKSTA